MMCVDARLDFPRFTGGRGRSTSLTGNGSPSPGRSPTAAGARTWREPARPAPANRTPILLREPAVYNGLARMDPQPRPARRLIAIAAGMTAIALLAALARLSTFANVFTPRGVRFVLDGDPYYHLRRAGLILEAGRVVWRDPWLNYPQGAEIPWPPLFDLLIAGVAWIVGAGAPGAETVSAVAAVLPVVLGIASIVLASSFAALIFGRRVGWVTAVLLAVSQPHACYSLLGRPDQHVLEILLFAAVVLAFTWGLRGERLRVSATLVVGGALALSFWNWLGSPLTLLVLGTFCVCSGIVGDPADARWRRPAMLLAAGSGVAAAFLAASIALAGPPGALAAFSLGGLSSFQVSATALTAVLAASLLLVRAKSRVVRAAGLVAVPCALGGVLFALVPALRDPVVHGLHAAGRASTWYGSIYEFVPLLFSTLYPLREELRFIFESFGVVPVVAAIGLVVACARIRRDADASQGVLLAVVIGVLFGAATLWMVRFMAYGSVPLAIFAALGLDAIRRWTDRRRRGAGAVVALAVGIAAVAPTVRSLAVGASDVAAGGIESVLLRVRAAPEQGDRRAVLAHWIFGHHVLLLADRPVIASPFGEEGGAGAMEDLGAFYATWDPAEAERLTFRRGIQYVLLRDPMRDLSPVRHGNQTGTRIVQTGPGGLPQLVSLRLYDLAGSGSGLPQQPALESFRLVDEDNPAESPVRLFEVVRGAELRVRGGAPEGVVGATLGLASPLGGLWDWRTARRLDAGGEARLRLPYATGANGRIIAGEYLVTDGDRKVRLRVTEAQVLGGEPVAVDLHAEGGTIRRAPR
jgi:hypothetical protein